MPKQHKQAIEPGLTPFQRVIGALLLSNLVSASLFLIRVDLSQNLRYWFLFWNLLLAWVPLGVALLLRERLKVSRWLSWQNLGLSLLYVGFLPNSFYLISDLIHLRPTGEVSHMFDAVMFASFIFNGVTAGFASVFLVHWLLIARVARERAHAAVGCILLLCSFAIYLGRELRWNTWDVLINPAGILFDVSERVINPVTHLESFSTTALFFILLGSMYIVVWQFVGSIRTTES